MRAFPPIKDLVTDVSWNFRAKQTIKKFKPAARRERHVARTAGQALSWNWKCIRSSSSWDRHVLRDHQMFDGSGAPPFVRRSK